MSVSLSNLDPDALEASTITGAEGESSVFRVHHALTLLSDGRVLVTGGLGTDGTPVASANLLQDDELTALVPMARPRWGHTATAITTGPLNGGVLITGGFTSTPDGKIQFAEGAEIYLPETL